MKFSLRHQAGLEEKLGQAVLLKLSELVGGGVIVKREIKCMSYEYNMNVYNVYSDRREDERIEVTMERMLDRWYEDTLCELSPSQASAELLRILDETCSNMVGIAVREGSIQFSSFTKWTSPLILDPPTQAAFNGSFDPQTPIAPCP